MEVSMANRKQIQDQAIRNSLINNKITHTVSKKQRGYPDLKSEVRNRLGMNQASNIWRTVENTKRVTIYRTGGIYNGYKY